MTDDDIQSIAGACITFGEARRMAVEDTSDGKKASAFLVASLATTLPTDAMRLIEEVERLRASEAEIAADARLFGLTLLRVLRRVEAGKPVTDVLERFNARAEAMREARKAGMP